VGSASDIPRTIDNGGAGRLGCSLDDPKLGFGVRGGGGAGSSPIAEDVLPRGALLTSLPFLSLPGGLADSGATVTDGFFGDTAGLSFRNSRSLPS